MAPRKKPNEHKWLLCIENSNYASDRDALKVLGRFKSQAEAQAGAQERAVEARRSKDYLIVEAHPYSVAVGAHIESIRTEDCA